VRSGYNASLGMGTRRMNTSGARPLTTPTARPMAIWKTNSSAT